MLDGVAEGAGANVEELYALNGRTELIYGTPRDADGGCTSIGVLDTHTASGHTLLGQNWDWHPAQREAMILLPDPGRARLRRSSRSPRRACWPRRGSTRPASGVCVNMLGSRPGRRRVPGVVPYHVLLRAVLEADHLGAARSGWPPARPRGASLNLLLGQAGTAGEYGGEIIDVEVVPGDVGLAAPGGRRASRTPTISRRRCRYATRQQDFGGLVALPRRPGPAASLDLEAAAARKVDEDDLKAVFRDHGGFPMAICRHVDERDEPLERSETVYSVLLDLDERRAAS